MKKLLVVLLGAASLAASSASLSVSDRDTLMTRHSYLYGVKAAHMAVSFISTDFNDIEDNISRAMTEAGNSVTDQKQLENLKYRLNTGIPLNTQAFSAHSGTFSATDELLTLKFGIGQSNQAFAHIGNFQAYITAAQAKLNSNDFAGIVTNLTNASRELAAAKVIYASALQQ